MRTIIGETYALYYCEAWTETENKEVKISGLYTVEDMVYPDRTCGQSVGGVWVFPTDDKTSHAPMYFVESDWLEQQIDPQSYGRMLVQEREMEFAAERFDREHGHLFEEYTGNDEDKDLF